MCSLPYSNRNFLLQVVPSHVWRDIQDKGVSIYPGESMEWEDQKTLGGKLAFSMGYVSWIGVIAYKLDLHPWRLTAGT